MIDERESRPGRVAQGAACDCPAASRVRARESFELEARDGWDDFCRHQLDGAHGRRMIDARLLSFQQQVAILAPGGRGRAVRDLVGGARDDEVPVQELLVAHGGQRAGARPQRDWAPARERMPTGAKYSAGIAEWDPFARRNGDRP